jgi:hypothetical protein
MASVIIRQIMLRRWFPPNDELAACVARMTILREDFAIEMMGLYEEQITPLDGNAEGYRKVYFWRNMLRTLSEIKSVVFKLNSLPEFRSALETQVQERKQQFQNLYRQFERTNDLLKSLRNDIGGHVRFAARGGGILAVGECALGICKFGRRICAFVVLPAARHCNCGGMDRGERGGVARRCSAIDVFRQSALEDALACCGKNICSKDAP